MFRELLESNGIKVELASMFVYGWDNERSIVSWSIEGVEYFEDADSTDDSKAREQACMQYCIENGVKLEWIVNQWNSIDGLDKIIDTEIQTTYNGIFIRFTFDLINDRTLRLDENGCISQFMMMKHDFLTHKLIAAIYAHDIKIIA